VEAVLDNAETVSHTFLGLTMNCCRCHDHKYDPITQKEYYSFSAYFNSNDEHGNYSPDGLDKGRNAAPIMQVFSLEQKRRMETLNQTIAASDAGIVSLAGKLLPDLETKYKANPSKSGEVPGLVAAFPLDGSPNGFDANQNPIPATLENVAENAADNAADHAADHAAGKGTGNEVTKASESAGGGPWVDGLNGKAIKFDGKDMDVNAGDAVQFERLKPFTISAWVNVHSDGTILSKMDDAPTFRGVDLHLERLRLAAELTGDIAAKIGINVVAKTPLPQGKWTHIAVTYNGSSKASGIKIYYNGKPQAVAIQMDELYQSIASTSPLLIGKRVTSISLDGLVQDLRVYQRVLTRPEINVVGSARQLQDILKISPDQRAVEQTKLVASILLAHDPDYSKIIGEEDAAQAELDGLNADPNNTTMVMQDLPKPRDTFILIRGQYDKHGDEVRPGVPAILTPLPKDAPPNRLGLARWIVDPANPLTSRVLVNRLWEKFFGVGIVKTSDNFGTQADWPSHPELLDWLACELIRQKWDLKSFQKMIVMSATYRQASEVTPDIIERDPENRLLSHGPRFRLTAEQVRDQALATSGLLVDTVGGPSVKPYEPGDLWVNNLYGNLSKYVQDTGEALYRRSMYTFLKRTAPPPNLMLFDMPSREYCVILRSRTDTPLQALDLMNDPTYVESARFLAQHTIDEGGATEADRVDYCFRRATARPPTAEESAILRGYLEKELDRYRADPASAAKLLSVGAAPADAKINASELAAYTMLASVVQNLDEVINSP
jgi:hypothetical protein